MVCTLDTFRFYLEKQGWTLVNRSAIKKYDCGAIAKKFIVEDAIMETSLPNVNTSDGCFNIGVLLSNRDFTEDAINMRKYEPYLLNDNSILSRIALLKLGIFGEWR